MKVLHVISDENIGGAGRLLTTLLHNWDRERVESVVALPAGSELQGRIRALGIPVRSLLHPCDRPTPASVAELCRITREENPDLVHTNAALSARIAARACGIPVLHTRHCCYPPSLLLRLPPISTLAKACNRSLSDRVIATADAAAENLKALGIPKERITRILNGSEPVREVAEWELVRLREMYSLSEEDFLVGICARLVPCKGHSTFLAAAREVLSRVGERPVRFLIVGTGELRRSLEREAHDLGIAHAVRFLGFVEDMAPVYRLLRINVNCSSGTETSCLALSEGMSASLPSVVSDYGGNPAMMGVERGVWESEVGLLFPVGDALSLADAICRLYEDAALEERMKRAALERYRKNYTAVQMSEHLAAVYEDVLAHRND